MPENHPFWGGPVVNKQNLRGTVKNWRKYNHPSWDEGQYVIMGDLYSPDGEQRMSGLYGFRTSLVVNMAEDETSCETLNSLYRLEDKSEHEETTT